MLHCGIVKNLPVNIVYNHKEMISIYNILLKMLKIVARYP